MPDARCRCEGEDSVAVPVIVGTILGESGVPAEIQHGPRSSTDRVAKSRCRLRATRSGPSQRRAGPEIVREGPARLMSTLEPGSSFTNGCPVFSADESVDRLV